MARYSSPFPLVGKGGDGGVSAEVSMQHLRQRHPQPRPTRGRGVVCEGLF